MKASSTHMMITFVDLLRKEKCHDIKVYEVIKIEKDYNIYFE